MIVVASRKHPNNRTKIFINIKNTIGLTSNPCKKAVKKPGIFF